MFGASAMDKPLRGEGPLSTATAACYYHTTPITAVAAVAAAATVATVAVAATTTTTTAAETIQ